MALVGFLFFVAVLATAVWSMASTIAPRAGYIVALLGGSTAAPVLAPAAPRRPVRRIAPLPLRRELGLIRAAA